MKGVVWLAWAAWRAVSVVSLLVIQQFWLAALTIEDTHLPGTVHARELHTATVNKVQNDAVGQLLDLNIRDVWGSEVTHVVTLSTLSSAAALCRESTQEEETLGIQTHVASLPEEIVRELHIDISHV
ncbi:hypothetical protein HG530_000655 [Fusarium avenaceum]|nr:hypothetical protein HG530_000655 [Fusarium avenaceum]